MGLIGGVELVSLSSKFVLNTDYYSFIIKFIYTDCLLIEVIKLFSVYISFSCLPD